MKLEVLKGCYICVMHNRDFPLLGIWTAQLSGGKQILPFFDILALQGKF